MDKKIRFGVQLPQEGVDWDVLKAHWQEADRLGYDHGWQVDHILTVAFPHHHPQPDCWTVMAALAEATTNIRIGSMVLCYAFRNPALLANMAATLDRISKGRLEFAIGAGWYQQEFEAYGYEFASPGVRLAQLDEAIQVYKAVWTQETANFEGKYYKVKNLTDSPKPVQQPHPRLWVGGGGEKKTLRLAAKYANAWNCSRLTPEAFVHKSEILRQHCQEVGRNFDDIALTWYGDCYIDEDEERVWHRARRRAENTKKTVEEFAAANLVGTPEQIAARIRQYMDVGVTEFICLFGRVADPASTRLFAEKVFPLFDHPVGQSS